MHRARDDAPEDGLPLVVLGCRIRFDAACGRLIGAAARRCERAASAYRDEHRAGRRPWVVVSGGAAWAGVVEADAMAEALAAEGVPPDRIVRERAAQSTHDNARFTSALLRARDVRAIALVTSASHMPRAAHLFEREGFSVAQLKATDGPATAVARLRTWTREGALGAFDRATLRLFDARVFASRLGGSERL